MIVLFTDFGLAGPYVGQMKAVLVQEARNKEVINLFADAPAHDPQAAAYLLAAYAKGFPEGTVFLCVVDPGVGSDRAPVVLHANGYWFVGPNNGLFELVTRRAKKVQWREITWRPQQLSASFHGRDLFAPIAARLARGEIPPDKPLSNAAAPWSEWPDDLPRIVYIDRFGNAMTGLRAATLGEATVIEAAGQRLTRLRTFSDAAPGSAFWYENANGLAEIAVNLGRADDELGLSVGTPVTLHESAPDAGAAPPTAPLLRLSQG